MSFSLFAKTKEYLNPIILCDYSDPDVIRTGDTFYMTASSFNFTPCLPILASHDLVNWNLINYAAENIPLAGYEKPQHAKGIWAPSIRFHNGTYYIFVATPDEGIFVTETKDPALQWSPLRAVWKGKGFIDPCPLWDDDGRVYVVHAYAKSRIGFNSKLGLLELDPNTLECKSEDIFIFDGTKTQPTIEGPKFYKRGDMYYILAPAGGVKKGWQTALRSKKITGPYEEKIVMVQGKSAINGPHQGGLTDTQSGEEWFVHFQDRGIYGRITHLEPVTWKDGWPCMGTAAKTKKLPGEPVAEYKVPNNKKKGDKTEMPAVILPSENAVRAGLHADMNWQWLANHADNFAAFDTDGSIELTVLNTAHILNTTDNSTGGAESIPVLYESANVLTKKISSRQFVFTAEIDASNLPVNSRTGIVFLAGQYASLAVEHTSKGYELVYLESENDPKDDDKRIEKIKGRYELPADTHIEDMQLTLHFVPDSDRSGTTSFTAVISEQTKVSMWAPNVPPYKPGNAQWVGGRYGVYAVGNGEGTSKIIHTDLTIEN